MNHPQRALLPRALLYAMVTIILYILNVNDVEIEVGWDSRQVLLFFLHYALLEMGVGGVNTRHRPINGANTYLCLILTYVI